MRKNEGRISIQVGNIFSQLGKKILQSCKSCRGPSHPHTRIYVCEANGIHIPKDSSFEPVFSTTVFLQLTLVGHPFQQRVERTGRYPEPGTCLKGLATGEAERQSIQKRLL